MKWTAWLLIGILILIVPVTASAVSYYYLENFNTATPSGWVTNFSMGRDLCVTNTYQGFVTVTSGGTTNALVMTGDPNNGNGTGGWDQWLVGRGAIFRPVNNSSLNTAVTATEYDPFGFVAIRSNTFLHRINSAEAAWGDDDNDYGMGLEEFWIAQDNGAGADYSRFDNFVSFFDRAFNQYNANSLTNNIFGYYNENEYDMPFNTWSNLIDPDGNSMNPCTYFMMPYSGPKGGNSATFKTCTNDLGVKLIHCGTNISIFLNLNPLGLALPGYQNSWIHWQDVPVSWSNSIVALFGLESPSGATGQTNSTIITHFMVRSVANTLQASMSPLQILTNVPITFNAVLNVTSVSNNDSGVGEVIVNPPASFGPFLNLSSVNVSNDTFGSLATITSGTPSAGQVLVKTNMSGQLTARFYMSNQTYNQIVRTNNIYITFQTTYTNGTIDTGGDTFGFYGDCYKHFDTGQDIMFAGSGIPYATTGKKRAYAVTNNSGITNNQTTVFAYSQPRARAVVAYSPLPLIVGNPVTSFIVKVFTETPGSPNISMLRILIPTNSTQGPLNNFSVQNSQIQGSSLGVTVLSNNNGSNFVYVFYTNQPSGGLSGYNGFDVIQFTASNTPNVPSGSLFTNYEWQVEVNSTNIIAGSTWQVATNTYAVANDSITNMMVNVTASNAVTYSYVTPNTVAISGSYASNTVQYTYYVLNEGASGNNVWNLYLAVPSFISNNSISNFVASNLTLNKLLNLTGIVTNSNVIVANGSTTNTNMYIWISLSTPLSNNQTALISFFASHTNTNVNSTPMTGNFTCFADNGNGTGYNQQFVDAPQTWTLSVLPPNPLGENRWTVISGGATNTPIIYTSDTTNTLMNEVVNLSPKGVAVKAVRMELATNLFPQIISVQSSHLQSQANAQISNGGNGTNYVYILYWQDGSNLQSVYDNSSEKDAVTLTVSQNIYSPTNYIPHTYLYKVTNESTAVLSNDYVEAAPGSVILTPASNTLYVQYPYLNATAYITPAVVDTSVSYTNFTDLLINNGAASNRIYYSYIYVPAVIGTNIHNIQTITLPATTNSGVFLANSNCVRITYNPPLAGGQTNLITFTLDDLVTNQTIKGITFTNTATNDRQLAMVSNLNQIEYDLEYPIGGGMVVPNVFYADQGETAGTVLTQQMCLVISNAGTGSAQFYSAMIAIPTNLQNEITVLSNLQGSVIATTVSNILISYTNSLTNNPLLAGQADTIFLTAYISNLQALPTNGLWHFYVANGCNQLLNYYFELTNMELGSRWSTGTTRASLSLSGASSITALTDTVTITVTNGNSASLPIYGFQINVPWPYTNVASVVDYLSSVGKIYQQTPSNITVTFANPGMSGGTTPIDFTIKAVKNRMLTATNVNWWVTVLYTNNVSNQYCNGYMSNLNGSAVETLYLPAPIYYLNVTPNNVNKNNIFNYFSFYVTNGGETGNNLYRLRILPPTNTVYPAFNSVFTNLTPISSIYGIPWLSNDGSVIVDYLTNGTNISSTMADVITLVGYSGINSVVTNLSPWQIFAANSTNIAPYGSQSNAIFTNYSQSLSFIVPPYASQFYVSNNINTVLHGGNIVLNVNNNGIGTNNILDFRVLLPWPIVGVTFNSNQITNVGTTCGITNGTNFFEILYPDGAFCTNTNDVISLTITDSFAFGDTNCFPTAQTRFNTSVQTFETAFIPSGDTNMILFTMPWPQANVSIISNVFTSQTNQYVQIPFQLINTALNSQNQLQRIWINVDPSYTNAALALSNLITNGTGATNSYLTNIGGVNTFVIDVANFGSGVTNTFTLRLLQTNTNTSYAAQFLTIVNNNAYSNTNSISVTNTNFLYTVSPPSAGLVNSQYDTTFSTNSMQLLVNNNSSGNTPIQRIRITSPTVFTNILSIASSNGTSYSNGTTWVIINYSNGLAKGSQDAVTLTLADNLSQIAVSNNLPWTVEIDNGTGFCLARELTLSALKMNLVAPAPSLLFSFQSNIIYASQTNWVIHLGMFVSNQGLGRNTLLSLGFSVPNTFLSNMTVSNLNTNSTEATNVNFTSPAFLVQTTGMTNGDSDFFTLGIINTNTIDMQSFPFAFTISNAQYMTNITNYVTVVQPPSASITNPVIYSTATSNQVTLILYNTISTNILPVTRVRIIPPSTVFTNILSGQSAFGGLVTNYSSNALVVSYPSGLPVGANDTVTLWLQNNFTGPYSTNGLVWKVLANNGSGYGLSKESTPGALSQSVIAPQPSAMVSLSNDTIYSTMTNRAFRTVIELSNVDGTGLNPVNTMILSIPAAFQTNLTLSNLVTNHASCATNISLSGAQYIVQMSGLTNGINNSFTLWLFNTNNNDSLTYPVGIILSNGVNMTNFTLPITMVKAPTAGLVTNTIDSSSVSNVVTITLINNATSVGNLPINRVRVTPPASLFSAILSGSDSNGNGGTIVNNTSNLIVIYPSGLGNGFTDTIQVSVQGAQAGLFVTNGVSWLVEVNDGTGYAPTREIFSGALEQNMTAPVPSVTVTLYSNVMYTSQTNQNINLGYQIVNNGIGKNAVQSLMLGVDPTYCQGLTLSSLSTNNTAATNVSWAGSNVYQIQMANFTNNVTNWFYLSVLNTNQVDQSVWSFPVTVSNSALSTNANQTVSLYKPPSAGLVTNTIDSSSYSNLVTISLNNNTTALSNLPVVRVRVTPPASLFSAILWAGDSAAGTIVNNTSNLTVTYPSGLSIGSADTLQVWVQGAQSSLYITNGVSWRVEADDGTGYALGRETTNGALQQFITAPAPSVTVTLYSNVLYTSQTNQNINLGFKIVNNGSPKNAIQSLTLGVDPTYCQGLTLSSLSTNNTAATNVSWASSNVYQIQMANFTNNVTNWFYLSVLNTNQVDQSVWSFPVTVSNSALSTNANQTVSLYKPPSAGLVTNTIDSSSYSNLVTISLNNNTTALSNLPVVRVRVTPPASLFSAILWAGDSAAGTIVNNTSNLTVTYPSGLSIGSADTLQVWVQGAQSSLYITNGMLWRVEADDGTGYALGRETTNGALQQFITAPAPSVTVTLYSNVLYTSQTNQNINLGYQIVNNGSPKNAIQSLTLGVDPTYCQGLTLSSLSTNNTAATNVSWASSNVYLVQMANFTNNVTNWFYLSVLNTNQVDQSVWSFPVTVSNSALSTNANQTVSLYKPPSAGLATNTYDTTYGSNLIVLTVLNNTTASNNLTVRNLRITPPVGMISAILFSNSAANGIPTVTSSNLILNYPSGLSKGSQDVISLWAVMTTNSLVVESNLVWKVEADSGDGYGIAREITLGSLLQNYVAPAPVIALGMYSNTFYNSQTNQVFQVEMDLTNNGVGRDGIVSMQLTVDPAFQPGLVLSNLITNGSEAQSVTYSNGTYTLNFPNFAAGQNDRIFLVLSNGNPNTNASYNFSNQISNSVGQTNLDLQVFLVDPPSAGLAATTMDSTTITNDVFLTVQNNTSASGQFNIQAIRITPPGGIYSNLISVSALSNSSMPTNNLSNITLSYLQGLAKNAQDTVHLRFTYSADQYETTNNLPWLVQINAGSGWGSAREMSQGALQEKLIIPSPVLTNNLVTGWYMINANGQTLTNRFIYAISNMGSGMNYVVSNIYLLPIQMSTVIPASLSNLNGNAQVTLLNSNTISMVYTNGRGLMPGQSDELVFDFTNLVSTPQNVTVSHMAFNRSHSSLPYTALLNVQFLAQAGNTEAFVQNQLTIFSIDHATNVYYQINNGMYNLRIMKVNMQFDNTRILVTNVWSSLYSNNVPFTTNSTNLILDYTTLGGISSKLGAGAGMETLVISILYTNNTSWTNKMAANVLFESSETYQAAVCPSGDNNFLPILMADFGRIVGTVLPANVTPIEKVYYPGSTVEATNRYGTNIQIGANGTTGNYLIDFVPGGKWDIGFSGTGYIESRLSNVTVVNNMVTSVGVFKMKRQPFTASATATQTAYSLDDTNTMAIFPVGTVTENFSLDIWVTNASSVNGMVAKTKGGTIVTPSNPSALNIVDFDLTAQSGSTQIGQSVAGDIIIQLHYNPADIAAQGWDENHIAIYYWKELTGEWIRVGGTVDKVAHTVSAKVNYLNRYYAILGDNVTPIAGNAAFVSVKVEPRVFTPTSANLAANTVSISVGFSSTVTADNYEVKIYNVSGKLIQSYTRSAQYQQGEVSWDGNDSEGYPVKSGVYIYRIIIGSNVYSGTIVIAR